MNKWQKIEELLNRILTKLLNFLSFKIEKNTPGKVKKAIQTSRTSIDKRKTQARSRTTQLVLRIKNLFAQANVVKQKVVGQIHSLINKVRKINLKEVKLASVLALLLTPFIAIVSKIKQWLSALQPSTVVVGISIATLSGLMLINIVTSGKKIMRETASIAEPELVEQVDQAKHFSGRPAYYKKNEKFFIIRNVQIPIYLGKRKHLKALRLELMFVPSNRYIKEYFFENTYLIRDRLNSHLELVDGDFPVKEEEGKRIIKDKVMLEVNKLIEELKIDGHIEDVHINYILAG